MIEETVFQPERVTPKDKESFDLIVIGSGPAGMSAAVCAARANLKVLVIEKALPGGAVTTAFKVDNFLGFSDGILGEQLGRRMEDHLFSYQIAYTCETVENIFEIKSKTKVVATELGHQYSSKAIVIAVGLEPKQLHAPFETTFLGRGISYFAQCDADSYAGTDVAVIGGGNCACYAADYLSQHVNNLYLIHKSDQLRAVSSLKEKVLNNPNIKLMWQSEVEEVFGIDKVEKMKVTSVITRQHTWIDVKCIFIYVGRIPPSDILSLDLDMDEGGFIITDELMRTSIPGVYAAGDIRSKQIRQIATAVSDGMIAAINAERDIRDNRFYA